MAPPAPSKPSAPVRTGLRQRLLSEQGPRLAGVLAAAAVLLTLGVSWTVRIVDWQRTDIRRRQVLADLTALRMQDWVASRMMMLQSIRAMAGEDLLHTPELWRRRVDGDLERLDGVQAINWVDADGIIRVTAPIQGNEGALNKDIDDHPVAGTVIKAARSTGKAQASPPLTLFQGGQAFTTYLPVLDHDDQLQGFVNGVFRVDRVVANAASHVDLSEHQVLIQDSAALVWASDAHPLALGGVASAQLDVSGRTWTLSLARAHPVVPVAWNVGFCVTTLLLAGLAAAGASAAARNARQAHLARLEAARMAQVLEESQRMEALGRVAGGIAHDFNNILTVVVGRASVLELMLTGAEPDIGESLQAIQDAGERGGRLVESLLTFARRGEEVAGQVDAAHHLAQLQPMLEHMAGRRVRLAVEIEPKTAPLGLAPGALDRLLTNLVSNAEQALEPDGGHVTVRLLQDPAGFRLVVEDDGPGIDPETRLRIFEPFFTTRGSGTGLGLATVFGLVRQAGGTIEVHTAPGQGARFEVVLPRVPWTQAPWTGDSS